MTHPHAAISNRHPPQRWRAPQPPRARRNLFVSAAAAVLLLAGCHSPSSGPANPNQPSAVGSAQPWSHHPGLASQWIAADERTRSFPSPFRFTNQSGERADSSALLGKPSAVAFFFTRCDNPNKCPLVVSSFAAIQRELALRQLADQVNLTLITYDPLYDTPQRLEQFGQQLGLTFSPTCFMWRPEPAEKERLFNALELSVNFSGSGVNIHRLELLLYDPQGRLVRVHHSLIWRPEQIANDLERLLTEAEGSAPTNRLSIR